jgi:hypothetical protein
VISNNLPGMMMISRIKGSLPVGQLTDNSGPQAMKITLGKVNVTSNSDGGLTLWPKSGDYSPKPVFCLEVSLFHDADVGETKKSTERSK